MFNAIIHLSIRQQLLLLKGNDGREADGKLVN